MAHVMTVGPHSGRYPGELMVASLGSGRQMPLSSQIVQNYLPDLVRNVAMSPYRSSPSFEVDELAQQVFDHNTPNSNLSVVRNALHTIFHNLARIHNPAGPDHVQHSLKAWLARPVAMELEARRRQPSNFAQTLSRFRSLVAISNAFTSEIIAAIIYDFFRSHYGTQICSTCSRKAAFQFALLLFSLQLLPDANVFSAFRQIIQGNPALFRRHFGMHRFANSHSADIWRLMEWVGRHWDTESFAGLPVGLHSVLRSRAHPRFGPRNLWLSRQNSRPSSWEGTDMIQRPRLQPRLHSMGSLGCHRSENALMDMADHMENLDTRLASLEHDHTRVTNTQDDIVEVLNQSDRYERFSDDDSDLMDVWT